MSPRRFRTGGVDMRAVDNLRLYLQMAVLPPIPISRTITNIPPEGHKSHANFISVRPERSRLLAEIEHLRPHDFLDITSQFLDYCMPFRPVEADDEDQELGESISVPAGALFDVPRVRLQAASEILDIATWLQQLPLQTAQRIMHVVWPHTVEWEMQRGKSEDVDKDLFQYFYWSQSAASPMREPNVAERSVVIAFQPPWILSPQDIQSFVKLNSFPSFEMVEEQDRYYQSAQRVWAKVWDVCFNKRCPWFVLSSGCDWVFGAFTPGWTRAFVSPVISMTQDNPSPLECLVYWLASANGIPNSWMIPKVPEPVHRLPPDLLIASPGVRLSYAESESDWDGKSEDAASSAGVARDDDELTDVISWDPADTINRGKLPPPIAVPAPAQKVYERLREWQNRAIPTNPRASPAPSDASDDSTSSEWSTYSNRTVIGKPREGKWNDGGEP